MRAAFGGGQFAKSLAWYFIDLLLAYVANTRMGLSASQTGLLLFLSMALGSVVDVGAAFLLRHAEGNRRQILILQFLTALVTAIALLVVFAPMPGILTSFLSLVAAVTIFRTAYAFYDVTQNALTSLLPEDEEDAHHYAVWRQVAIAMARIGVAGLAFLVVGADAPAAGHEIFLTSAMALLIVLMAGWMACWAGTPQPRDHHPKGWTLSAPRGLAPLLLAAAALAGPIALLAKLAPFVDEGVLGDQTGAALLFAIVFGTVVGPLALPRPGGNAVLIGAGFTAATVIAATIFLADVRSGPIALAACFAYGLGAGGMLTLFWRTLSTVIRDHARRTDVRTDMAAFALVAATTKLAGALFGASLSVLLTGFKAGSPMAMLQLALFIAAGGICFLVAMLPTLRSVPTSTSD